MSQEESAARTAPYDRSSDSSSPDCDLGQRRQDREISASSRPAGDYRQINAQRPQRPDQFERILRPSAARVDLRRDDPDLHASPLNTACGIKTPSES
ncbi:MAG: hypothetical protein HND48_05590 [Chloroflexi bacterium]|nr:hypothetical protein [Chloroflexota bacterium]